MWSNPKGYISKKLSSTNKKIQLDDMSPIYP